MSDTELPDPETLTSDQVYTTADGHTFQGRRLEPFSIRRQYAAQSLGNKLLCGGVSMPENGGAYEGMFTDVVALLHLCLSAPSESMLAMRKPEHVLAHALDWAERIGLNIGSPAFREATKVYGDIIRELLAAQFTVEEKEDAPPKNA